MNKKSLVITTGAMVTAIFGVMLWLNRQSGALFQEIFIFLYPIPMVAFSALYGLKNGIPVCVSMSLLSFLFGDFTTIFYAMTQAIIGLVFGGCLHHKVDMTKTLFVVMILSALVSVLDTIVLGFLFGMDLNQEVAEIQMIMTTVFQQNSTPVPESLMETNTLKQFFVVSMILAGALQGFVVYEVSLLLLRRLRFPVQKPKSVFAYRPPVWTAYGAFLAFLIYNRSLLQPFGNEMLQNVVFTVGIFGCIYLLCFGFIALLHLLKTYFPKLGKLGAVICVLGLFVFATAYVFAGFLYIAGFGRQESAS